MKRIVIIALRHPEHENLYLHLLKKTSGKWTCPGGHLIPGETPKEAARRELREETGVDLAEMEELRNGEYPSEYGKSKVHLLAQSCQCKLPSPSKKTPT